MFSADEVVVYGTQGVCRVKEISMVKFGSTKGEYYILSPISDPKALVYVPTEKPALVAKMRPVLSRAELDELLRKAASEKTEWIESDNERKAFCDRVIKGGDRGEIMGMITMLYNRREELKDQKRHFHNIDAQYLKAAERLLHDEFAYILGIEPVDVPEYIKANI